MAKASVAELIEESVADDKAAQAAIEELRQQDAAEFEIGKPAKPIRTAIVNTVDAKGEAIAVDVPNEPAPATPAPKESEHLEVNGKPVLPGFEGLAVDGVVININGRPEINIAAPNDFALWQSLRIGARIQLQVEAVVVDRKYHLKLDKDGNDDEMTSHASLKATGISLLGK